MKLTITFEELDLLTASLGSFVDDDEVDEDSHAVASALLDRLLVATNAVKNTPLDQPFPPTSFDSIAEIEVTVRAVERFAKWEASWNEGLRTKEDAARDADFCAAMISRLYATLHEVLDTRSIEITVLPDRGE